MMIIRHLQYLTALARERHFARAATLCNVTQSTLSAGIKQLEESLGVLIVERGQRFLGLTEEGERVLAWAQRVLADYSGLQQELSEMREGMVGQLRIGAIPVTLPIISLMTAPFAKRHGRTDIVVTSQTSIEIQRRLDEFNLDVGVTYLDNEPLARVRSLPLYQERYVLLTRPDGAFRGRNVVSWSEAASLPLCLLTPTCRTVGFWTCTFTRLALKSMLPLRQTRSSLFGPISDLVIGRPWCHTPFSCCSQRGTD
jgi:DNA-binding transcriptional LysR family regulator